MLVQKELGDSFLFEEDVVDAGRLDDEGVE